MIAWVTLVVAFCSMAYELLLAQTLSATMGNTIFRYNLTIGLYLASLGLGAFLYGRKPRPDPTRLLVDVELALSLIGSTAPVWVLLVDAAASLLADTTGTSLGAPAIQALVYLANHGLIVAIGLLSGYELPLLMALGAETHDRGGTRVLIIDYAGTLAAAISFPLLLLPALGVFGTAAVTGLLNLSVALVILLRVRRQPTSWRTALAAAAALALAASLAAGDRVARFAIEALYFRGLS